MSRRHLSRQAQAFEALLAPDSDDEGRQGSGRKGRRSSGRNSLPSCGGPTPGFRLKSDNDASTSRPTASATPTPASSGLAALLDLFSGSLPPDIIKDVFHACGDSQEAAIDALLAMSGGTAPTDPPPPPASPPAAHSPSSTAPEDARSPNLWDALPQECKLLILDRLSLRDLAAAAPVSREFAAHVASQRRSLRRVVVPPGLSPSVVRGLVASFTAATAVDFSRCTRSLRFSSDFEDAAEAVAAGAAARAPGSAPVEELSLARCAAATAGDVAAVTAALPTLRRIDLSRCPLLGDPTLGTLARYRRSEGGLNNEENDETAAGEAAAALAATTLETPSEAVERVAAAKRAARVAAAEAAAAAAGGLEEINVVGSGVTARGVGELLRGSGRAPSLLVLDVSRCAKVTGDALVPGPTSLLRVLRAAGCPALHSLTLALPAGSGLREITLADCKSLREVTITSAPALEELNVSGCGQLMLLSLRCPALRRLRASGCARLALGAAPFECPSLQSLNLFGCRSVETAGLEAALPGAPALVELDLSGCVGLGRVVATAEGGPLSMLRVLRLDGCALLRVVTVAAPGLRSLSSRACVRLMELRLLGASPRIVDLENCGELREVSVASGVGGGGGGSGSSAMRTKDAEEEPRKLVLRGCDRLPQEARDRLRESVLGSGGGGGGRGGAGW